MGNKQPPDREDAERERPFSAASLYRLQIDPVCCIKSNSKIILCSDALADIVSKGESLEGKLLAGFLSEPNELKQAIAKLTESPKHDAILADFGFLATAPQTMPIVAHAMIKAIPSEDCFSCTFSFPAFRTKSEYLMESSKLLKEKAIDAMPYAMNAITSDGRVSVSNNASKALFQTVKNVEVFDSIESFDLRQWTLYDKDFHSVIPVEDYPMSQAIRGEAGGYGRYGCILPDATRRLLDIHSRTLYDTTSSPRQIIGGVTYSLDRTDDVEQEQRNETERKELRQTAETADSANKSKTSFLSTISHEIRTPIAALLGLIDLLLATQLNETQRDYAQTIRSQISVLLSLVSDVLDLNKIEAGRLQLEMAAFDLRELIEGIAKLTRYSLNSGKPVFESEILIPDDLPLCVGDHGRIRQIVANLLSNAAKFAKNGHVLLKVEAVEQDDAVQCTIIVRDDGIGATREQLAKMFQPFSQADSSTTRLFGGSGLGLSICRNLLEEMHGQIRLESAGLGEGCTATVNVQFPIHLPVSRPESAFGRLSRTNSHTKTPSRRSSLTSNNNSPSPKQSRRTSETETLGANLRTIPLPGELKRPRDQYTILVAEDNPVLAKVTAEMVKRMGFGYLGVTDGQAAVDAVANRRNSPPDQQISLILMDLWMPKLTGLQASRQIRETFKDVRLPIIALTASVLASEREDVLSNGLQAYFCKPVKYKTLENEVVAQTKRAFENNLEGVFAISPNISPSISNINVEYSAAKHIVSHGISKRKL